MGGTVLHTRSVSAASGQDDAVLSAGALLCKAPWQPNNLLPSSQELHVIRSAHTADSSPGTVRPDVCSGDAAATTVTASPRTAVQLIKQDGATFSVCPEAIQILDDMGDQPLAVVAIAGTTRQGKSYILNRLANTPKVFKVAGGSQAVTHGIWLWSEPTPVDGQQHRMVYLDTEGVGSLEQTIQHLLLLLLCSSSWTLLAALHWHYSEQSNECEAVLVSLAGMVSSLLIYNRMGAFNGQCVSALSQIAATLKRLDATQSRTPGSSNTSASDRTLLVLLRDHMLTSRSTVSDDVEAVLAEHEVTGWNPHAVEEQNDERAVIKQVFSHRLAHALPAPACRDTTQLEGVLGSVVGAEFNQGVSSLRDLLFRNSSPKELNGVAVTGPMMVQLLQVAVAAANAGKVPSLTSLWGALGHAEIKRACTAARAAYDEAAGRMQSSTSVSVCESLHKAALAAAKAQFTSVIKVASASQVDAAWEHLSAQWDVGLKASIQSIKRQHAEAKLQLTQMLVEARTATITAFNQEAFAAEVLSGSAGEAGMIGLYRKYAGSAWAKFYAITGSWTSDLVPDADVREGILCTQREVVQTLTDAYNLAKQKLEAREAECAAQKAAAERERVKAEQQTREIMRAKVQKATEEYTARLLRLVQQTVDEDKLMEQHNVILSSRSRQLEVEYASLPESARQDILQESKAQLTAHCRDILADICEELRLHNLQLSRTAMQEAKQQALNRHTVTVQQINPNSTDVMATERLLKAAADQAISAFTAKLAGGFIQPALAKEYDALLDGLRGEIRQTGNLLQQKVCNNKEAADKLQLQTEAFEAARRRQQQEALEQYRLQQQQHAERRRQEEERLRRQQQEAEDRRRQQELEQARQRHHQQQLLQAAIYSGRCSGYYVEESRSSRCGDYYIKERGSSRPRSSGCMEVGPRGNTFSRDSRGRALNKAGRPCGQCAKGGYCGAHNPKPK